MFKNLNQVMNQNRNKYIMDNYQQNNRYEPKEAKSFQSVEESAHWISFNLKKIKEVLERLTDILASK